MKPAEQPNYSLWQLVSDLWSWLGSKRVAFGLVSLLRAFSDLIWLYPAFALGEIVNFLSTYQSGQSLEPIFLVVGLLVVVAFMRTITREISRFIAYNVSERTALDAQLAALKHLFSLDLVWHEQSNAGNKIKRLQNGAKGIDDLLRMWIDNIIETFVQVAGIVFILASFDQTVSLGMVLFALTYLPLTILLTKHAAAAAHEVNVADEELSGVAYEAVGNVRSAKVLGMSRALVSIAQQAIDKLFAQIRERIRRFRTRDLVVQLYSQVFYLAIVFFSVWQVLEGSAPVGLLVLVYDYFRRVNRSLNDISDNTQKILVSRYAISRMRKILNEPLGIDEVRGRVRMPDNWQTIQLRNIEFSYERKRVLQNISLTIERGERVGIVGVSGAGKSTLFKLLLKEYETGSGKILIDDVPIGSIRRDSFVARTAVVLQDTEVFNFTLRDNIALANWKYRKDDQRLKRAAKIAHVTDFMDRLPDGFDTYIGEKGIRLSGGEKQRVGLARAIFKEPEILFLDEATSHLDSESEAKIQDSLQHFFKSVTAIVIAHRLSTIRQMDTIYVLEEGRVIETGSFAELLKQKGRFAQMWDRQKF